jgi:hypothetical protein
VPSSVSSGVSGDGCLDDVLKTGGMSSCVSGWYTSGRSSLEKSLACVEGTMREGERDMGERMEAGGERICGVRGDEGSETGALNP